MKHQTETLCLMAVQQEPLALSEINHQTEAVCLAAVRKNGYALFHVKDQTEAVCWEAIKQDPEAIQYVKHQTETMQQYVIQQDSELLRFVPNPTFKTCIEALKSTPSAIRFLFQLEMETSIIEELLWTVCLNGLTDFNDIPFKFRNQLTNEMKSFCVENKFADELIDYQSHRIKNQLKNWASTEPETLFLSHHH